MGRQQLQHTLYFVTLFLLVASIPVSTFGMNLAGFLMVLNWIFDWNWREKWLKLKSQRLVWLWISFVALCLVSLCMTEHFSDGLANVASKLPLLYVPLVMASSPVLDKKKTLWIMFSFVGASFVGSILAVIYYYTAPFVDDMREISRYISHIRFSLCVDLSIVMLVYVIIELTEQRWKKILLSLLIFWFVGYLFFAQTLTGIVILFILSLFFIGHILCRMYDVKQKRILLGGMVLLLLSFSGYVTWITYSYFHVSENEKEITTMVTSQGHRYSFDLSSLSENGHLIDMYVCEEELLQSWQERSKVSYWEIAPALKRYLNSKGLRKDAQGVGSLSDKDIVNIEHGIANVSYTESCGLKRALYPTFFSLSLYAKYHDVQHSSLLERVELWRAACSAIKQNVLLGYGIGDHKAAIDCQLQEMNSPLVERTNRGAHSQFLTLWLMGGVILLFFFMVAFFYPLFGMKHKITWLYVALFVIVFCSMFTEDTLETTAGMNLFAVMNAFLLLVFDKDVMDKDFIGN